MAISICIPTYNRLDNIKKLINMIREGLKNYPYEIIVGDGGSTDGTIEYLKDQKDVFLIEIGELTGSVKAFNYCFKKAKYEYILWPSDDFLVNSDVIIKCCNLMDKYEEIGLISPKMIEVRYLNYPNIGRDHNLFLSKTHIFRTSALKKINFFDETYKTYFIDVDSHLEILNLGYSTIYSRESGIIHTRTYDEIRNKNRGINNLTEKEYYDKKWEHLNFKLDEYANNNPLKKFKVSMFLLIRKMLHFRPIQIFMKRQNLFMVNLYDFVLQQCVLFNAKEYNHLKDFYLAQKLPREVLLNNKD